MCKMVSCIVCLYVLPYIYRTPMTYQMCMMVSLLYVCMFYCTFTEPQWHIVCVQWLRSPVYKAGPVPCSPGLEKHHRGPQPVAWAHHRRNPTDSCCSQKKTLVNLQIYYILWNHFNSWGSIFMDCGFSVFFVGMYMYFYGCFRF